MKKQITGKVIKESGCKTKKIEYHFSYIHPKYKKLIVHNKHKMAHDEHNIAKIGDQVIIEECRPISKLKSFFIKKVIS